VDVRLQDKALTNFQELSSDMDFLPFKKEFLLKSVANIKKVKL